MCARGCGSILTSEPPPRGVPGMEFVLDEGRDKLGELMRMRRPSLSNLGRPACSVDQLRRMAGGRGGCCCCCCGCEVGVSLARSDRTMGTLALTMAAAACGSCFVVSQYDS